MAINAYAREAADKIVVPIARGLVRIGVTANGLTFAGLVITLAGVWVLLAVSPLAGAVVLAAGQVTDAFDGAVARIHETTSQLGAFYDSVVDRAGEAAMFASALWLVRDEPLLFAVGAVAWVMASLTSYIRAKAESLGLQATVGLLERAERAVILVVGLGLGLLTYALWVLAVGSAITVGQRLVVVVRQAREGAGG